MGLMMIAMLIVFLQPLAWDFISDFIHIEDFKAPARKSKRAMVTGHL
jgi:hypothetical protein